MRIGSHFFAYLSRMRFIQRWALMRNTAPENVQEHSHQVAVLAHALAVIRNEKFGGHADAGAVAVAALYHDASEILTGDMPTPIKYDNPAIRKAYKEVEAVAEARKRAKSVPQRRLFFLRSVSPAVGVWEQNGARSNLDRRGSPLARPARKGRRRTTFEGLRRRWFHSWEERCRYRSRIRQE